MLVLGFMNLAIANEQTTSDTVFEVLDESVEQTPAEGMLEKLFAKNPGGFALNSWIAIGNGALADYNGGPALDHHMVGINQLGIRLRKDGEKISFTMDVMFGRDSLYFESHSNSSNRWDYSNLSLLKSRDRERYDWAVPQFYLSTTIGETFIKAGHFLVDSHTGHYSTQRFFATRTDGEMKVSPYTLTGVLAKRTIGKINYHLGWSKGVNTGFDDMAGVPDSSTLLFGFQTKISETVSVRYNGYRGELSNLNAEEIFGVPMTISDSYGHDLTLTHKTSDKLTLVFYWGANADKDYFRQSAFFFINEQITIGQRYEKKINSSGDVHCVGLNITSMKYSNLVLRPEIRIRNGDANEDWDGKARFFMDAVLTY
jgi:hypothetical protein